MKPSFPMVFHGFPMVFHCCFQEATGEAMSGLRERHRASQPGAARRQLRGRSRVGGAGAIGTSAKLRDVENTWV